MSTMNNQRLIRSVAPLLLGLCIGCGAAAAPQASPPSPNDPGGSLSNPLGGPVSTKPTGSAAATAPPAGKSAFREIKWDDLVPKDWDPLKQFKNMNLTILNDADPRANAMLKQMRETWDNAPTNREMDGATVRIPGYLVPLEDTKSGMKEFLLVPYFGACIHTPPPPANQIIFVKPQQAPKGFRAMDTVWVNGTLHTLRSDSYMGASGYRMDATLVEAYVEKVR